LEGFDCLDTWEVPCHQGCSGLYLHKDLCLDTDHLDICCLVVVDILNRVDLLFQVEDNIDHQEASLDIFHLRQALDIFHLLQALDNDQVHASLGNDLLASLGNVLHPALDSDRET
jgi:hypothetical protein